MTELDDNEIEGELDDEESDTEILRDDELEPEFFDACSDGDISFITEYIKENKKRYYEEYQINPLMRALNNSQYETTTLLVQSGFTSESPETFFEEICEIGSAENVKIMIEKWGVRFDMDNIESAIYFQNIDVIKLILSGKYLTDTIDINMSNSSIIKDRQLGGEDLHEEILKLIIDAGGSIEDGRIKIKLSV